MALPNIFSRETVDSFIQRINQLNHQSKANWGTMTVAQMLAHCNVTYEMVYTDLHPKPNKIVQFILKLLVKNKVVNEQYFSKNDKTAPQFVIKETKDFEVEKQRLIGFIIKTQEHGEDFFNGKDSNSFGKLNSIEWNNMFYKHLQHHLTQFGV